MSTRPSSPEQVTANPRRPAETPPHDTRLPLDRVNPVTKLGGAVILSFPLFITLDWVSAVTVVVVEIIVWLALQPQRRQAARTLALHALPFIIAAPLAGLSMALYGHPGGTTYFSWGPVVISEQSVSYGLAVAARVLALGTACLVTLTGVDPTDLADGLAQVWHWPARFVLGTLAGVRLVTRLVADWQSMKLARRARGLGDHGALRRFATLAFALLVSAIRRGSALATAMEARGFGQGKRTWARPSTVSTADAAYLLITVMILASGLVISLVTNHFRWIGQVL